MPKDLIEDLDACIQYMYKQLEDGTLGQHISNARGNAFGQWYLYGNAYVLCAHAFLTCHKYNFFLYQATS